MAPTPGLEPGSDPLTAGRTTIVLDRNGYTERATGIEPAWSTLAK